MTIINPDESTQGNSSSGDPKRAGSPNYSIVKRLNFTLRLLLLSLLITGIVSTAALIYINSIESNLTTRVAPLIGLNDQINTEVLSANLDARNYILTQHQVFLSQFHQSLGDYQNTYQKALKLQNSADKQHKYLQDENVAAQQSFATLNQLIRNTALSHADTATLATIVDQTNSPEHTFENRYVAANIAYHSQQSSYTSQIRLISISGIGLLIFLFLISLILGLRQSYFISAAISGMLDRLIVTLNGGQNGDASLSENSVESNEEYELASAISDMIVKRNSLQTLLEQQYEKEKTSRQRLEEERTLREALATTLYEDLDATSAFQKAIEGFGKALRADQALVRIMENGKPGPPIFQWDSPSKPHSQSDDYSLDNEDQLRQLLYSESDHLLTALTRGSYVGVDDVANDDRLSQYSRMLALQTGLQAFLSVPVVGESGPEAILVALMEGKTRVWNDRDVEIATTLATGLGATLAAIRLYDVERRNLDLMRQLDKAKDEFLASVTHELRTPLTSIIGYLELLKDEMADGNISEQYGGMLDAIDRNSVRLLGLIENVLTASRIESGKLDLSTSSFAVSQLISTSVEAIRPQANSKQISIDIQIPPEIADITGDVNLLDRALLNLLSNAIKFTPPGGTITIEAKEESGNIEISVADTGMGISQEEIGHMFTKFYRTTEAKQQVIQGTGLGLSITKAIIEAHSGAITVESTLGQGTKFTFTVPVDNREA